MALFRCGADSSKVKEYIVIGYGHCIPTFSQDELAKIDSIELSIIAGGSPADVSMLSGNSLSAAVYGGLTNRGTVPNVASANYFGYSSDQYVACDVHFSNNSVAQSVKVKVTYK